MLAIGAIEFLRILVPALPLRLPGIALLLLFCAAAVLQARRATLVMAGVITALLAALCIGAETVAPLMKGLEAGLLLAAFMPVLMLIRGTADASPEIAVARLRFAALTPEQTPVGYFLGAYGGAIVLSTGAQALLAALLPADADERFRLRTAAASLRGGTLAALWSPFFVSLALTSHYLPMVPAWQIMPLGFAMAAIGLLLGLAMFERGGWTAIPRALHGLGPLVGPIAGSAGLVVAGTVWLGFSTLQSVVLIMPPACIAWVLLRRPGSVRGVLDGTYLSLGKLSDEVLIVTAAISLGTAMETLPELPALLQPWLVGLPVFATLLIVPVVMILLGQLGAHPMISGTLVLVAFTGIPGGPHPLCLMQAVLIGWGLGAMTSPSGIQLMVTAMMFRVPFQRLTFGENLIFSSAFTLLQAVLLSLLNAALIPEVR
jgi:hypothetical protein